MTGLCREPCEVQSTGERKLNSFEFDAFICHASEDKTEVAEPLANMLSANKVKVWYDKFTLKVGDRLRQKIDYGLAHSRYGVVILSPSFFKKDWPQRELDGLAAIEDSEGRKVILPIWHNVNRDDVVTYSPTLAGIYALTTSRGLGVVLGELLEVILEPTETQPTHEVMEKESLGPGFILGHSKLYRAWKTKRISFVPDIGLAQIGLDTIDLKLGFQFAMIRKGFTTGPVRIDTFDPDQIERMDLSGVDNLGKPRALILHPSQFVLAYTLEKVRLPNNVAASVEGRTSLARYGLSVASTSSHLSPGFEGIITLELFNQGPLPIELHPGKDRICHLIFYQVR
jgi:deoxycytidine triphosphate deaminase